MHKAKPLTLFCRVRHTIHWVENKRLIKNEQLLSYLLEKEKEYRNNEGSKNNEEQSTDSEEDEKSASENSQSQETEKQ